MGFITLKDGALIHASLLNPSVIIPYEYKITSNVTKDFEDKFIYNQIDVDSDVVDLVNKEFWNLI